MKSGHNFCGAHTLLKKTQQSYLVEIIRGLHLNADEARKKRRKQKQLVIEQSAKGKLGQKTFFDMTQKL